jgi:hypothetical protein
MARSTKTPEQRLAELEQQKQQIAEKIKRESAKLKAAERKRDTRRKIIAGALALENCEHDSAFREKLFRLLADNVTRADDRALFDLPAPAGK